VIEATDVKIVHRLQKYGRLAELRESLGLPQSDIAVVPTCSTDRRAGGRTPRVHGRPERLPCCGGPIVRDLND
jgi:hypothetical protein